MIENEVLKNMTTRFSCRKYSDQTVEKEKIEAIIHAAKYAPSRHNKQAWHFTIITSKEAKELYERTNSLF